MKNIIVINGPEGEDVPRLKASHQIYESGDRIIACRFNEPDLESTLQGDDYVNTAKVPRDTFENAYYSRHYVKPKQGVVLVTSDYHIDRASYIFEKILKKPIKKVSAPVYASKKLRLLEKLMKAYSALVLLFEPTETQYMRYRSAIAPLHNALQALLYRR
ncbi:MAG: ElyC/SanA/YdcF family protein [Candidatus Nanoarchaeia archaeon]|nr:ElyC/SanA/YdcF family protein [Candidatus Nanoarchaeia archaeon]MDD5239138.1 ElyC/SanA/YdcF family protein [Candidatus Nanoarchaeia archaeon]